jgi:hypothetical protein
MNRLVIATIMLGTAVASAQPSKQQPLPVTVVLPAVGDTLPPNGAVGWPTPLDWTYGDPAMTDAAGKIVIHWFCAPKIQACTDDLARITTLKENSNRVYVIAYINGTKADAKKLDPIRESEGVGRGTLASGKNVTTIFKKMGIVGPASLVVDVAGKVALVTTGSTPAELDARDAKVNTLAAGIKEYTATVEGPKVVKAGEKFPLSLTIKLASWLTYSKKPGTSLDFKVTPPKDIKCDNTLLKGDQLKPVNQTLTATVNCSGPKGSYEFRGQINFGYDTPSGATGIGTDGANWKFEIK